MCLCQRLWRRVPLETDGAEQHLEEDKLETDTSDYVKHLQSFMNKVCRGSSAVANFSFDNALQVLEIFDTATSSKNERTVSSWRHLLFLRPATNMLSQFLESGLPRRRICTRSTKATSLLCGVTKRAQSRWLKISSGNGCTSLQQAMLGSGRHGVLHALLEKTMLQGGNSWLSRGETAVRLFKRQLT